MLFLWREVVERRVGKQNGVSLCLLSEAIIEKHVLRFQVPPVRIRNVCERQRQASQLKSESINVIAV